MFSFLLEEKHPGMATAEETSMSALPPGQEEETERSGKRTSIDIAPHLFFSTTPGLGKLKPIRAQIFMTCLSEELLQLCNKQLYAEQFWKYRTRQLREGSSKSATVSGMLFTSRKWQEEEQLPSPGAWKELCT